MAKKPIKRETVERRIQAIRGVPILEKSPYKTMCEEHGNLAIMCPPDCPNREYEPWNSPNYRQPPSRPGEDLVVKPDDPARAQKYRAVGA